MEKYHLKLTSDETALVKAIDLSLHHEHHADGHAAYLNNQQPILALIRSLDARKGLPDERLKYWLDPTYHTGRIKASRQGLFERNGCKGDDIYTHPHFIKYLRYFLFGSELPDVVIQEFEMEVGDPRWVNGGDAIELGKFARQLVRRHGLDRTQAPEEFFKLCLDIGLGRSNSERIMASVKKVR